MGRGLGKIQHFILDHLKERPGWTFFANIPFDWCKKQEDLSENEDWWGSILVKVYQSFARAARTLEKRGLVESKRSYSYAIRMKRGPGGLSSSKYIRLVHGT